MHSDLEDWKNGWFGVQLGLKIEEIDRMIASLQMLKKDPEQHFHLTSDYKGSSGVGDITIYVQSPTEISNMTIGGKALPPGHDIG